MGNKIDIELSEKIAEGEYSNLVIVNHSPSEFVLDFVNMMPGVPKSRVRSRVILSPQNAKKMLSTLSENIGKFEEEYGKIKDYENSNKSIPISFGPSVEA